MSKKLFTEKQQQLLRQNPYIYSVTDSSISLTKEFKEIFMEAYKGGESPRSILENHGFDFSILGERRIWSISQRIREEFKKHGEFHEGYRHRNASHEPSNERASEADELKQLRHEVDYLKQEIEFLKKISSIKTTRK